MVNRPQIFLNYLFTLCLIKVHCRPLAGTRYPSLGSGIAVHAFDHFILQIKVAAENSLNIWSIQLQPQRMQRLLALARKHTHTHTYAYEYTSCRWINCICIASYRLIVVLVDGHLAAVLWLPLLLFRPTFVYFADNTSSIYGTYTYINAWESVCTPLWMCEKLHLRKLQFKKDFSLLDLIFSSVDWSFDKHTELCSIFFNLPLHTLKMIRVKIRCTTEVHSRYLVGWMYMRMHVRNLCVGFMYTPFRGMYMSKYICVYEHVYVTHFYMNVRFL